MPSQFQKKRFLNNVETVQPSKFTPKLAELQAFLRNKYRILINGWFNKHELRKIRHRISQIL